MDWEILRHEMDVFEKEVQKAAPISTTNSLTDQCIAKRLKPGMDASEVDEIVNEEY